MNKKMMVLLLVSCTSVCYTMELERKREFKIGIFTSVNGRESQEDRFYFGDVDGGKMFAVYDGHGKKDGHEIAHFAAENMPKYFNQTAHLVPMHDRMVEAFKQIDKNEFIVNKKCGTTASLAIVENSNLHFAHVGDSRMLLLEKDGRWGFVTNDHRYNNDTERMRVEKSDGVWFNKRVNGSLKISRALGDYHIDKEKKTVIAKPEYIKRRLGEKDKFLILATDGLWDVMSNNDVSDMLIKNYSTIKEDLSLLAKMFVLSAITKRSTDNITVMIVDLLS